MQDKATHLQILIQEKESELFDLKMESNQIEKAQSICKVKHNAATKDLESLRQELSNSYTTESDEMIILKANIERSLQAISDLAERSRNAKTFPSLTDLNKVREDYNKAIQDIDLVTMSKRNPSLVNETPKSVMQQWQLFCKQLTAQCEAHHFSSTQELDTVKAFINLMIHLKEQDIIID